MRCHEKQKEHSHQIVYGTEPRERGEDSAIRIYYRSFETTEQKMASNYLKL